MSEIDVPDFDGLGEDDELDVLLYPAADADELTQFLSSRKAGGVLDYNILSFANCIAVKAKKRVLLELADRRDVKRIVANPKFSTHG